MWKWEVKVRLELHNLHTDQILLRSELKYLIVAKVVGPVKLELWFSSNPAKKPRVQVQR